MKARTELSAAADSASRVELALPARSRVWFISDLHLWLGRPRTVERFRLCVERAVCEADALFILGDLFEYWAGDDDIASPAVVPVVAILRMASDAGLQIGFMHGNRDFLAGSGFARAAGVRLLGDPCALRVGALRVIALHGDLLCTDDLDYQRFRAQVRDPAWQAAFLGKSLAERHAIIADLRARSEDRKSRAPQAIMDTNAQAVAAMFAAYDARLMIHGHTHRPARHETPAGVRWVLPDWEFDAGPARGGGLVVDAHGVASLAV